MTAEPDQAYIVNNRKYAERLLILLGSRRLLLDRVSDEDSEYCRRSAHGLRNTLEGEMLLVEEGGFLVEMLRDLQRACTAFVSAAGSNAQNFQNDPELFVHNLETLRLVFAQRVGRIVEVFGLTSSPEVQSIIDYFPTHP